MDFEAFLKARIFEPLKMNSSYFQVPKSETARTIAANNIVNAGFMVAATLILTAAVQFGVTVADSLLIVAVASIVAAWLGWKLEKACH